MKKLINALRFFWFILWTKQKYVLKNSDVSDTYHTFDELYLSRLLYNAGFANEIYRSTNYRVIKSKKHSDGTLCFGGGWFIVVIELPTGQISNHYKEKDWDLFKIPAEEIPTIIYDDHTPNMAFNRLRDYLEMTDLISANQMIEEFKKTAKTTNDYLSSLKTDYETLTQLNAENVKRLESYRNMNRNVTDERDQCKRIITKHNNTITSLNEELSKRDIIITELTTVTENRLLVIEEFKKTVNTHCEVIDELKNSVNAKLAIIEAKDKVIKDFRNQIDELNSELYALKSKGKGKKVTEGSNVLKPTGSAKVSVKAVNDPMVD